MQQAETGILEKPKEELKLTQLAVVSIDKDSKIYVNWPVDKKELVITAMAEAIKLVANYKSNIIEKPNPSVLDFIRGVKR